MMNVEEFFAGGRARAPWTLSIADAGGSRQVESSDLASSYGLLQTHSVDVQAQEDGKAFVWSGPATFGLSGPVADMTRRLGNSFALRLDWRVDAAGTTPVTLALGGAALDIGALVRAAPAGAVWTLKVPLRCFADGGANLARVDQAVSVKADKGFAATLLAAKVEAVGENLPCPAKAE